MDRANKIVTEEDEKAIEAYTRKFGEQRITIFFLD